MDAATTTSTAPALRFNPLLPYFAVFQTDSRQTLQSWIYRLWVIVSVVAAAGYGLYKFGIHREVGLVQSASEQTGILIRTIGYVTVAFVSLIAVVGIGGERTTVADSILSRGISRTQYYLAKWHARTLVVFGTFAVLAAAILTAYHYLLEPDLTLRGGIAATLMAGAALAAVMAWGVAVGALANGSVIGITIFWLVLFGAIFLTSFLPETFPSPAYFVLQLRGTLRGQFEVVSVGKSIGIMVGIAVLGAMIGLIGYGRKDV